VYYRFDGAVWDSHTASASPLQDLTWTYVDVIALSTGMHALEFGYYYSGVIIDKVLFRESAESATGVGGTAYNC